MKVSDEDVSTFFLQDLVESPVVKRLTEELQAKHVNHRDEEGDFTLEYWVEYTDMLNQLLYGAVFLNTESREQPPH